jgi:cytochrome d ubiquinol oxidase subunit I
MIPLPWIAVEAGWAISELGRQPWSVDGVLPTFLAASSLSVAQVWTTIVGFTLLYTALAVVEIGLIVRVIQRGPYAKHEEARPRPVIGSIALAPAE